MTQETQTADMRHGFWHQHRFAVVSYGLLALIWIVLWRLPVLMGDDRFFANASGLPGGAQTWQGLGEIIAACWYEYNGRLADGLGAVLFGLGDTGVRLVMAAAYVAFTAMSWAYAKLSCELAGRPALSITGPQSSWAARLLWALFACWPFALMGLSLGVAGESIMLMAATWNYILPLTGMLATLYPLFRRAAGRPLPLAVELGVLPLVFVTMLMHEVIAVAAVIFLAVALTHSWQRGRLVSLAVAVATLAGLVVKFQAPGLWGRMDKYAGADPQLLGSLRSKIISAAMSLNLLPTKDIRLLAVLVVAVALAAILAWRAGVVHKTRMVAVLSMLTGAAVALLAWLAAAMGFTMETERQGSEDLHRLISNLLGEALICLACAAVFAGLVFAAAAALWRNVLTPVTIAALATVYVTVALVAYSSTPHYAQVHRSFYLTSIMVMLTIAMVSVDAASVSLRARRSIVLRGVVAVGLCVVALNSLVTTGAQLATNRIAWHDVEAQAAQARDGQLDQVNIPKSLPCRDVTWYFQGPGVSAAVQQWRVYYGIPEGVEVKIISTETHEACPLT